MMTLEIDAAAAGRDEVLYRRLASLGIDHTTHAHAPVFTVEEARALRGQLPGTHCKCLFLKDKKDKLFLAVLREELEVDLKWLAGELGSARFSFGKPELLWQILRVRPGAVTPFALMNDLECQVIPVLDAAMLEGELVNYHPLRNDRTTAIEPAALVRFIESCGHRPIKVRFPT